jgi:hypothetical protein
MKSIPYASRPVADGTAEDRRIAEHGGTQMSGLLVAIFG